MPESDPESPSQRDGRPRRTVLRAIGGLALTGGLAGCNDGGDNSASTASSTPADGTATASATDTPMPTAPPTETPALTPSPTASPSPTATATATATQGATGTRVARAFVTQLRSDEFGAARERFTDEMGNSLTRGQLERYWLGLRAQHGDVRSIEGVESDSRDGTDTTVVTVACPEADQGIEVVVTEDGQISGLWFTGEYSSPAYVDESAFTERTTTVEPEGCSLPATVTVPADSNGGDRTATATDTDAGSGVPGVVLVHGSGAHDRDETIGPNKPFRDLAHGLATRGVAVLRYEKRTAACDVLRSEWAIDDIIVDDAVHALGVLRDQPEIDPDRTVVAGHSVGATCVPRIAERDGAVAGGAVLAGNARPFTEVYPEQVKHIFAVQAGLSSQEERQLSAVKQLMGAVENGSVADSRPIGPLPGIWWKSLFEYDQVATANRIDAPLFVAHGGRDFQIPIDPALSGWREGLDDPDTHRFERYPDLSHLFHTGFEPSVSTEYAFRDNVAGDLVADLATWVTAL